MPYITDDQDNLVPVITDDNGDEWVETSDGHWKGAIDIADETVDALIDTWAHSNLDAASLSQYVELKATAGQAEALRSGVLNSILLAAITEKIERVEAENNNAA